MKTDVQPGGQPGHGAMRAEILRALRAARRAVPVEDVAAAVGIGVSGTRWHLDRLVESGAVRKSTVRRPSRGRPRLLYRAAPAAEVDEAVPYRMLASLLAAEVGASTAGAQTTPPAAFAAGRTWAAEMAPGGPDVREAVLRLLDDTGFRPRVGADPSDIELDNCPFFDVAAAHPEVVCGVHLGLLRGAVDRLGAPDADIALIPVLDHHEPCRVRLTLPADG